MAREPDSAGEIVELSAPRPPIASIATGPEFHSFALDGPILRGLLEAGYERCTPIQEKTLPISLQGRDVASQAQTGSGKTAAFLITIFQRLGHAAKREPGAPRALILAPTRELALQIHRDATVLGKYLDLRFVVTYGGVAYQSQLDALRAGVDVVIATPGRLIDYIKRGEVDLRKVTMAVVDEADRMFDLGFIADLRYILRKLPPYSKRQSMLFSATLSMRVLELTYEYMNVPEEITTNPDLPVVETVEQVLYHVARAEKFPLLLGILKHEAWHRVLIFTNTKAQAAVVADKLSARGHQARALTGDLTQQRRTRILSQFKQGRLSILVATDVASRGLHVEDISHVINYDVPMDREEYVHRIGRTARAGKPGKAITLACEHYVYYVEPIEEFIGQKIPVAWPEEGWFVTDGGAEKTGAPQGTDMRVRRADRTGYRRPPKRVEKAPLEEPPVANEPLPAPVKRGRRRSRRVQRP
jgi:ATP-dependent RNA helicase RhlB